MAETTIERIRARLVSMQPLDLEILDDSARHAGHPGAASGGGHYTLRMTSPAFVGLPRLERHRLVYNRVADLMQREIHALAMTLLAPDEVVPSVSADLPNSSGH